MNPAVATASSADSGLEERLEEGQVVVFAPGELPLPPEEDMAFLRDELGKVAIGGVSKNISYHPWDHHLSGIRGPLRERTKKILHERSATVEAFLGARLPRYASGWKVGKVNFRPIQEKGRKLSQHASNERLHTDAFASGATHGDRIFRFFTNIHPTAPRVWRSAGTFPKLLDEFGAVSGVSGRDVREGLKDRAITGIIRGVAKLPGLSFVELADTSPYDRTMLKFHNHLKDDDAFQTDESRCVRMSFPPFSSWMVMTDMVSHAAVEGQHALVNTFYVSLGKCVKPELAPFNILASTR